MTDTDTKHAPIKDRHICGALIDGVVASIAQALADSEAQGQLAGLKMACRVMCARCRQEEPVSCMESGVWVHGTAIEERCGGWTCEATRIRNMMQALQDAGGIE